MSGRADAGAGTGSQAGTAPAGRRGKRAQPPAPVRLGSLLQTGQDDATCPRCGGTRVTRIAMSLSDGTPVRFTSCRACEHQWWEHAGQEQTGRELAVAEVLDRTRRTS